MADQLELDAFMGWFRGHAEGAKLGRGDSVAGGSVKAVAERKRKIAAADLPHDLLASVSSSRRHVKARVVIRPTSTAADTAAVTKTTDPRIAALHECAVAGAPSGPPASAGP